MAILVVAAFPSRLSRYTFRPRKAVDKYDRVYVNFSPAVSRDALKAMRQTIRGWRVQLKNDRSVADLSAMLGPILRVCPRTSCGIA